MPVYSTHQAKTHLSERIRMVERAELITITRGGRPVAVLVRIGATPQPRCSGTLRTTLRMNPTLDFRDGPRKSRPAEATAAAAAAAPPAAAVASGAAPRTARAAAPAAHRDKHNDEHSDIRFHGRSPDSPVERPPLGRQRR